eukprot:1717364-Alexandrium_andersonii.AAC.1
MHLALAFRKPQLLWMSAIAVPKLSSMLHAFARKPAAVYGLGSTCWFNKGMPYFKTLGSKRDGRHSVLNKQNEIHKLHIQTSTFNLSDARYRGGTRNSDMETWRSKLEPRNWQLHVATLVSVYLSACSSAR